MSQPLSPAPLTPVLLATEADGPSQQQLLALEQSASAALAARRPWLLFEPRLEAQFERDATAERVVRFRTLGVIALVILNLFNITDRSMLPDIAERAMTIRLGILTPVMATALLALYLPSVARWREWILAALVILVSASLIYFFTQSQHPNALQYHTGVILIVMFGNIVIRQRFWFAFATSVLILVLYMAGIAQLQHMAPEIKLNSDMVLISAVAGLVTYTMGFVDWVSFDATTTTEDDLNRWGEDLRGIPGFFSYEVLLNPGKFLILMGALAVAAVLLVVPAYRRALPLLAVLASGGWFALLSAALALPGVVDLGAGAIIALIFGFLQAAALVAAAFVQGLERT